MKRISEKKKKQVVEFEKKANNSILMKLELAGMAQNKQKCLIFVVVNRVSVKNQIS